MLRAERTTGLFKQRNDKIGFIVLKVLRTVLIKRVALNCITESSAPKI